LKSFFFSDLDLTLSSVM